MLHVALQDDVVTCHVCNQVADADVLHVLLQDGIV